MSDNRRENIHLWMLRVVAVALLLPVVAGARLLAPASRPGGPPESIFKETNRQVLTALGFALMA
jgi:hypothetical protein